MKGRKAKWIISSDWSEKVINFSREYSSDRRVPRRRGSIRKVSTAGWGVRHGGQWRGKCKAGRNITGKAELGTGEVNRRVVHHE